MSDKSIIRAGYTPTVLSITALTNMHPGSGKNSYGVIDNLVQRDVTSGMPIIQASSLKGALREYCTYRWGKEDGNTKVRYIFGADTKDNSQSSQGGAYIFMPAQLISIPARSDIRPYFMATAPMLLQDFISRLSSFGINYADKQNLNELANSIKGDAIHFIEGYDGEATIENLDLIATKSESPFDENLVGLLGNNVVLLSDEKMKEIVNDLNLPIIARNNLENGISQNLWYEQVLPRQTRFITVVLSPGDNDPHLQSFIEALEAQPVQIGANASIGYGFSDIKTLDV
jgi:CRISPR-associated protein Cmr4